MSAASVTHVECPFALEMFIPSMPSSQPRAKVSRRNGIAMMYSPTTLGKGLDKRPHPVVEFRYAIKTAVQKMLPDDFVLLNCPLSVSLVFWFDRKPSLTKKTRPNPPLWKISKPDRDNLDKSVLDCLTGVVWLDDNCVCDGRIQKAIVAPGQQPGVEIVIREILADEQPESILNRARHD